MKLIEINILEQDLGKRLDKVLKHYYSEYSRNKLTSLIKERKVCIGNHIIDEPSFIIKEQSKIFLRFDLLKKHTKNFELKLNIIFEDEHLIVLNKPAGILTHCTKDNTNTSIVDLLKVNKIKLYKAEDSLRDGVVHRLDKDTSGLIVLAKNKLSYSGLISIFAKREVTKVYDAFCWGVPSPIAGIINRPITDYINRKKISLNKKGKEAITEYKVKKNYDNYFSFLECKILTGRTHQIRVHMKSEKCPLIGDSLYSRDRNIPRAISNALSKSIVQFKRQALHSKKLIFCHPISKNSLSLSTEMPQDMKELEKALFENLEVI